LLDGSGLLSGALVGSLIPDGWEPHGRQVKLAFFNEMRHSYGRSALMLSGGAVLGLYHVGVVKVT